MIPDWWEALVVGQLSPALPQTVLEVQLITHIGMSAHQDDRRERSYRLNGETSRASDECKHMAVYKPH